MVKYKYKKITKGANKNKYKYVIKKVTYYVDNVSDIPNRPEKREKEVKPRNKKTYCHVNNGPNKGKIKYIDKGKTKYVDSVAEVPLVSRRKRKAVSSTKLKFPNLKMSNIKLVPYKDLKKKKIKLSKMEIVKNILVMPLPPSKKLPLLIKENAFPKDINDLLKLGSGNFKPSDDIIPFTGYAFTTLYMLLYLLKKHKNDCLLLKNTSRLNFDTMKLEVNIRNGRINSFPANSINEFWMKIKKCIKNKKIVVIPIGYKGHFNILIINYHLMTAEHYEPHGDKYGGGRSSSESKIRRQKIIENGLNRFIKNGSNYGVNLKYIGPSNIFSKLKKGFQAYEQYAEKKHKEADTEK